MYDVCLLCPLLLLLVYLISMYYLRPSLSNWLSRMGEKVYQARASSYKGEV